MSFIDNSRKAIGNGLLDVLRTSGIQGLHVNALLEAARINLPTSIQTAKDIQPILMDLANSGMAVMLGNDKWQAAPKDLTVIPTPTGINPEFTVGKSPKAVHPPTVQVRPTITLPGHIKFTSYKNSLQEYCQKVKLGVPKYHPTRITAGLLGTVQFYTNHVQAKTTTDNPKDADQRAAHQALIDLEYFDESSIFEELTTTILKRKDPFSNDPAVDQPPTKQAKPAPPTTHKSLLNQLAQKNGLPIPQYNTVSCQNGFFSTVTFNGREFKSERMYPKKKEAEQNAAYLALHVLTGLDNQTDANGMPPAQSKYFPQQTDVSEMISEARQQSGTLGQPGTPNVGITSLKNRLQEYCQRLKKNLPFYQTCQNEDLTYTSMVTVEDKSFTGQGDKTKKGAERAAAESALKALGLMAEQQ